MATGTVGLCFSLILLFSFSPFKAHSHRAARAGRPRRGTVRVVLNYVAGCAPSFALPGDDDGVTAHRWRQPLICRYRCSLGEGKLWLFFTLTT